VWRVAEVRETIAVTGIHCMRCVSKIGDALRGVDGLLAGSATLAGDVHVVLEEGRASRADVAAALAAAGFPPADG
jgi:copper chaperone CopZ